MRDVAVDVVLDEPQTWTHLEQVEQGDRLLVGAVPLGHGGGGVDVEQPVADEDPDGGVRHRLGRAPRHQSRLGVTTFSGPNIVAGCTP